MLMVLKDKQTAKNKRFRMSLFFAMEGIKTVIKEERNMRIHLMCAMGVVLLSFCFNLKKEEWIGLLVAIFLVFLMEIINTVAENMVDLLTDRHYHLIGKKVKDIAAAGVLVAVLLAIIIGAMIFIPNIYLLVKNKL